MTALLEVADVRKRFGSIRAVDGASFSIERGSLTGLIGPNGSGKTTLFNIITGYLRPDHGTVRLAGHDVTRSDPGVLYRRGLSRTFQQARILPQMTVVENLVAAGGYPWRQLFGQRVGRADRERVAALLEEFSLAPVADLLASELSYGQRKLLEFATVLMREPMMCLLDEPTAGVNPVLVNAIERHIRHRHATGITFLIVEHDLGFVTRLCESVIVLDRGREIFTGPSSELQSDPLVLDAYLGS